MSETKDNSKAGPALALGLAALLLLARIGWEVAQPVSMDAFKGLMYIRDLATVFPAGLLAVWALAKLGIPKPDLIENLPRRIHPAVVIVCLGAICALIAAFVLRRVPHIVDEATYLFQSETYAHGSLTRPVDGTTEFLGTSQTLRLGGKHYGVFFPAWPVMLVPFVLAGIPWLLNPILIALLAFATFKVGNKLFGQPVGFWSLALLALSPFAYLQGSSFFSHVLVALAALGAVALWLGGARGWKLVAAGLLIGVVLCARPLTAVVLGMCLLVHAVRSKEISRIVGLGIGFIPGAAAFLMYNAAMTGNMLKTTHDQSGVESIKVGAHIVKNLGINGTGLIVDGPLIPGFILLLAFLGLRKSADSRIKFLWTSSILVMLAYSFYTYHGFSYGPRFFFDVFPLMCLAGGATIADIVTRTDGRIMRGALIAAPICIAILLGTKYSVFGQRGELYSRLDTVAGKVQKPALVLVRLKGSPTGVDRLDPAVTILSRNDPADNHILYGHMANKSLEQIERAVPDRYIYTFQLDTNELKLVHSP